MFNFENPEFKIQDPGNRKLETGYQHSKFGNNFRSYY
jgi:hypothetical protein